MAKKPPPLTASQQAALDQQNASNKALSADPYNLDISGYGALSQQVIQGGNEFFGLPTSIPSKVQGTPNLKGKSIPKQYLPTQLPPLTATAAIGAFTHLTGAKLAQVQDQMYRAGYYSANYVPKYGLLGEQDVAAFRSMMIGLASNPSQATLTDYLNQASQQGDSHGLGRRSPLVIKLTNPDDLRVTLQKTVQDLYGGNLPEDDVQKFINSFQSTQAAEQTAAYTAGGFNPETGQSDLSGTINAGGTVTAVASPTAAAETYVRTKYPNQVAATQFGNVMNDVLAVMKNPAA